jgi:hypothetical protein
MSPHLTPTSAEVARNQRWQQHFDDWCLDNIGGREPSGREISEAEQYADEMMEEEDNQND